METNKLNLFDDNSNNGNGRRLTGSHASGDIFPAAQGLPKMIEEIVCELQEFPQRADEDDERRDTALLLVLHEIYPWALSEEQIGQLDELDRDAERQMEFWQNRCDWFSCIRDLIKAGKAGRAAGDANEAAA